jgi:hypothetical protein
MAGLSMTFWPNPVYRNHTGEKRWHFSVAVRETGSRHVHLIRYRGEWYDPEGRLQDSKEDRLDIQLGPLQHASYSDLWVTSAIPRFRYRLIVYGQNEEAQEVSAEAVLRCQ